MSGLRSITTLLIIATSVISGCSKRNTGVTEPELMNHIAYLASDDLEGRMTGTAGDSLSAEYIRKELLSYGLKPVKEDGFQRFSITSNVVATENNQLQINGQTFSHGSDFITLAISENSRLDAEVVYAGYGFDIDSDTLKWNDYDGLDVTGKWVMILRADPDVEINSSSFAAISGDRYKAMTARDKGAAGVIFVSGEKYDPNDEFENLRTGEYAVGLPVIRVKREVATIIAGTKGLSISDLERSINETRRASGFTTGARVMAVTEIERRSSPTRNVAMLLPGSDPVLGEEYVIIGAHFDHIGMGGEGSSSRATDTVGVHYGADDNASGVAMMLEIAQKFAGTPGSNRRSLIFVAFTGEEMGLLGSKYFVDNSPVDLKKVNAMINLDMVGRMKETNTIQISGAGTAVGMRDLLTGLNDTTLLRLALSDEGYGPSDHSAFYGKDIPVIFISTGAHLDYHTPSDSKEKINYQGMITISDYLYTIAERLASEPNRLAFTEAGPKDGGSRGMRRKGVTLGIMPDFAGNIQDGLRADFVTPGRPAALGGMVKGDIIKSINGKPVGNIEDYMFRLNQLKPGETITLEIERDGKRELLLIQL